tara:strand:- start:13161 stop:13595 length:435 start_codon:yes stop_codon:yes gene_type:complete
MNKLDTSMIEFIKLAVHPVKDQVNPHYKNKFASLNSIQNSLRENAIPLGLWYKQETQYDYQNGLVVITTIGHIDCQETQVVKLPVQQKDMGNPQHMGSGLTYARRYSLSCAFGLPDIDDDANEGSGKKGGEVNTPQTTEGRKVI